MPAPAPALLDRRDSIVRALRAIVPGEGVIATESEMRPYESDALTAYRQMPLVVVLPDTVDQLCRVLKYCHAEGINVVPRGAGTSLSGGALPASDGVLLGLAKVNRIRAIDPDHRGGGGGPGGALPAADGVLLGMAKFNRIREIDLDNRVVVAEPGVTNLAVTEAVEQAGFYYAPDPSSQIACTIGGNVAENSGGVHCLKYGVTSNNVLGLEVALMTGEMVRIGGKYLDSGGYDLLGVMTGSEGLLGVVTEVTVRILRKPECARAALIGFAASEAAGDCVARIVAAGIIPGGMEMMDRPAIHAVEQFVHAGYPLDVEALLIVELDGAQAEVDHLLPRIEAIAADCRAVTCRVSGSDAERLLFWAGRKAAFPAVGRISPDYYCMDGTIPRAQLPFVLKRMREMSETHGLAVANVVHAGDGNLHPLILYDANKADELDRAEK